MSRILLLSPWIPPPDGVGFHSVALVTSWRAAGHEVLVVTSRARDHKVSPPSSPNSNEPRVMRTLRLTPRRVATRILFEYQPDVVIVQFTIAGQNTTLLSTLRLMRVARRSGLPVVVAFHEPNREIDRLGSLSRWIYQLAARSTTHPVVYSPAGGAALVRARIFTHVSEIPLGCVPVVEVSPEVLARVRDRYAITAPLVLSLGFVHPDKGTELLVTSISEVTRLLEGNVQFLFAGSPRERRGVFRLLGRGDRKFHHALMKKLSLLKDVSTDVCGFVPDEDVAALLFLSSAVVLPYRRATQSAIANLALSARAVIVASDIQELRDDLGTAARYFHSESVPDLTEAIVSVLTNSQEELRIAASTRASERSYDTTAASLLRIGLLSPVQPL